MTESPFGSYTREQARRVLAGVDRQTRSTRLRQTNHEFVRRENADGGHRDRECVECGLSDTNPVHRSPRTNR